MLVTDIGCHPLSKKITLFVGSILLTNIVTAHKCFVCGPNNKDDNVVNNGVLIPTCDHFDPKNQTFIRECKPETKACNIQTNGTTLTRTCELHAIVDCKFANNVEYCFCGPEPLCNMYHPNPTHEDDEEDFEGSGTERQPVTDVTNVLQVPGIPNSTVPTAAASSTTTLHRVNINTLLIVSVLVFIISCDMYFIL